MDYAYSKAPANGEGRRRLLQGAALLCLGGLTAMTDLARATTRRIPLGQFSRVRVDLPAMVRLRPGSPAEAVITAEPAVMDKISVAVRQDELRITANAPFNTREALSVDVRFVALRQADMRGAGDLDISALKAPEFSLFVSGSGNAHLRDIEVGSLRIEASGSDTIIASGHAGEQQLKLAGSFTYQGEALRTEHTRAQMSGAGSGTVWATQSLQANVDGAGSLRYRGSPQLQQQVSGAGSIEQL